MTVQEKIHEYLSVHRDEMVEDIKTLIKVDSARAEALAGKADMARVQQRHFGRIVSFLRSTAF